MPKIAAKIITSCILMFTAIALSPTQARPLDADALTKRISESGLNGTVMVSKGDNIIYERAFGSIDLEGTKPHRIDAVWRWASVSKQVAATIVMMEVAAGHIDLEAPIIRYLPDTTQPFADRLTVAQLLQHLSGLRSTDDGPFDTDEWPMFYRVKPGSADTGRSFCEGPTTVEPGTSFHYGDCDYVVLAAILEKIHNKPYAEILDEAIIRPLGLDTTGLSLGEPEGVAGFVGDKPEPLILVGNSSAAGAMYGTMHDMWRFDRALMLGKLIPDAQRAQMWAGNPKYGFAAFGQWSFDGKLKNCAAATPIVERRGSFGGVQIRNIILPKDDLVLIAFSNRSEDDFAFGEIWQQAGLSHDMLDQILCP